MKLRMELVGKDKLFRYFDVLQDRYGKTSMPRIVRSELIYLLNSLAKSEKKAKLSSLVTNGRRVGFNRAAYGLAELSINSGRRGAKNLAWVKIKTTKGVHFLKAGLWDGNKSVQDNQWQYLVTEGINSSKEKEKLYKESRGTTAKTWYDTAKKVAEGGDTLPDVQEFVKRAKRKDGKPSSISLFKRLYKNSYEIDGIIRSGVLSRQKGQFRFDFAYQKRTLFYKRALKMGWLDDASFCKKYCAGIVVTQ